MIFTECCQVTNLRKERETIIARQQGEPSSDSQRVRVLQRENAQLHLKVKGLLTELEEIRAQREHLGMQSDHVSRLQSKQLQEHAANIRALEVRYKRYCFIIILKILPEYALTLIMF